MASKPVVSRGWRTLFIIGVIVGLLAGASYYFLPGLKEVIVTDESLASVTLYGLIALTVLSIAYFFIRRGNATIGVGILGIAALVGLGYFAGWKWPLSIIVAGLGIIGFFWLDTSSKKYIPLVGAAVIIGALFFGSAVWSGIPTVSAPSFLSGWTWVESFGLLMVIVVIAAGVAAALGKIAKKPAAIIAVAAIAAMVAIPFLAGWASGPALPAEEEAGEVYPKETATAPPAAGELKERTFTNESGEFLEVTAPNGTVTVYQTKVAVPSATVVAPQAPTQQTFTNESGTYVRIVDAKGVRTYKIASPIVTTQSAATTITTRTVGGFNYSAEGSYNQIYDLNKQDEVQSVKEKHSKALVVACAGVGDPEKAREACQRTTDNASEIYRILGK